MVSLPAPYYYYLIYSYYIYIYCNAIPVHCSVKQKPQVKKPPTCNYKVCDLRGGPVGIRA